MLLIEDQNNKMKLEVASINVAPKDDNSPSGATIFIFQNGQELEDYVLEFVDKCHLSTCDSLTLMEGFWCGLDEEIRFVMPRTDPCWKITSGSCSI